MLIAHAEEQVGIGEVGVDVQGLVKLVDGLVGAPGEQESPPDIGVDVDGEKSSFLGEAELGDARVVTASGDVIQAVPEVRGRVLRVKLDGALKFLLGGSEVEVVGHVDKGKSGVGLGDAVVEPERFPDSGLGQRAGLGGAGDVVNCVDGVRFGQPGVSQRIGGILLQRLLELLGCLLEHADGPLVPSRSGP